MENQIPLGKQLKYALQEKGGLKEIFKDWFELTPKERGKLIEDYSRAAAEVAELEENMTALVALGQEE